MRQYAIAYEKNWISNDYIVFIPQHYLEGDIDRENDVFLDKGNEAYRHVNQYNRLLLDTYFYHGVISEEELLELYSTKDVVKAISDYYLEACESIIVGKINYETEQIELCELPLRKILGLTKPITYGMNSNGTSEVKLTKSQLQALALEEDLEEVRKQIFKYIKNMNNLEKLNETKNLQSIVIDSLGVQCLNYVVSTSTKERKTLSAKQEQRAIIDSNNKALETYNYIVSRLIGQNEAVEDIVSAVINNMKANEPRELIKPFVIGPTGSGKSLLFELLGKCLEIPVISVDCNLLVQAGYEGKDINDVLKDLYYLADGDIFKIEHAIILFDEIDKIAANGASVSDVGVQQALLKFIEGTEYVVELSRASGEKVNINTSMMTIVAGGAFDKLTAQKSHKPGFNSEIIESKQEKITVEQLQEYGMISELLGRFNLFVQYNKVTEEMLYNALTASEISPIKIKQQYFLKHYGVKLTFNESFYRRVCSDALKRKSGFRGLNQVVNSSLTKLSFKLQCHPGVYQEATIGEETIDNPLVYKLSRK